MFDEGRLAPPGEIISSRLADFPKAAVVAFYGANGGTMVLVGNRDYLLPDISPWDFLEEVGGEDHFARIEAPRNDSGGPYWVKRRAVKSVEDTNFSIQQVSIWLYDRAEALVLRPALRRDISRQIGYPA